MKDIAEAITRMDNFLTNLRRSRQVSQAIESNEKSAELGSSGCPLPALSQREDWQTS